MNDIAIFIGFMIVVFGLVGGVFMLFVLIGERIEIALSNNFPKLRDYANGFYACVIASLCSFCITSGALYCLFQFGRYLTRALLDIHR